ncbi:MAG: DUF935 domain-containing protein [bacterium]
MPLLDRYGNPIDTARLRQEEAAPSLMGVRQPFGNHPEQGLTPGRLAALLREAEMGDPTRYLELAEAMEEKDLHYAGVLGTRKRAVSQLKITVEPAGEDSAAARQAEFLEGWLERDELQDELIDILDAIGKGYSLTEILWDTSAGQWLPERLEWRDPRWFEFDQETMRRPLLRDVEGPQELTPFKYVYHCAKAKSGLPVRGGLARLAAWGYLFKNYTVKDWVSFAESYGQPLRVGKYNPGATEAQKEALLRALAQLGSDAAAIVPTSMLIEFVESGSKTASSSLYKDLAEYIDKQLSKAVLGQTLTTEVSEGSRAAATVHDDVREDIERADARQLAAALNRDLVRPVIALNFGEQKAYPRLRIGREEQVNLPEFSTAVTALADRGLRMSAAEVRRKAGLSEPEGDEEVFGGGRQGGGPERDDRPSPRPGRRPARAAAGADDDPPADSIQRFVDGLDDEWEEVLAETVEGLDGFLGDAKNIEDARGRLAEALKRMPSNRLQDLLARAGFAARLAGEVGAEIQGGEE